MSLLHSILLLYLASSIALATSTSLSTTSQIGTDSKDSEPPSSSHQIQEIPPVHLEPALVDSIWNSRHLHGVSGRRHRYDSDVQYLYRRKQRGLKKKDHFSKEDIIKSLPPELEGTTLHQRNTIRRRLLGLTFNERMPALYKGLRTGVYMEAERMREENPEMTVIDAIKLAYARDHIKLGLPVVQQVMHVPNLKALLPPMTSRGRRSERLRLRREKMDERDLVLEPASDIIRGARSHRRRGAAGPSWRTKSSYRSSQSDHIDRKQRHASLDLNTSPLSSP